MILVTGDVVLDHNIYAGQRFTPDSDAVSGMQYRKQPGGAMLTYGLLEALERVAASSSKGKDEPSAIHLAFGLQQSTADALQNWPSGFQAGAVWEPFDSPKKGQLHWRLSKNLGYGARGHSGYPASIAPGLDELKPKVLVIDDGGLGFRLKTASQCWPPLLASEAEARIVGETTVQLSQLQLTLDARGQGNFNAAIQPDGTFVFREVAPAAHRVSLGRMQQLYIKSIHWGITEITDTALDLTNGVPPRTDLSIVLGADSGQVEGVVTNEKSEPCDGVTVTLIPTGTHRSRPFYKFPVTDGTGKFAITGIAPGPYKLLAWDKVDNNAVMFDPDFLRPYESNAQTVEVLPGGKKTLDLKLTLNKEQ